MLELKSNHVSKRPRVTRIHKSLNKLVLYIRNWPPSTTLYQYLTFKEVKNTFASANGCGRIGQRPFVCSYIHLVKFLSILRRTHGRNVPKCGMLMYPHHLQKYRNVPIWNAPRWDTFDGASIPCHSVRHEGALCAMRALIKCYFTYDCLKKPKPAKQVVVAAMVILSNRCRVWTMYLCLDSIKFVFKSTRCFNCVGAISFCDN